MNSINTNQLFFNNLHIDTYLKYVGKSLNKKDENGNNYIPDDYKNAQSIIKEAHHLVKEWAINLKDKIDPTADDPNLKITATNQQGNFRDYLPQTFFPKTNSSSLLLYWVFLDTRVKKDDIFFRITLGLNDWKASLKARKKFNKIKEEFGGEDSFSASISSKEILKHDMDFLVNWSVSAIKNLPLNYVDLKKLLEPELSEIESDDKMENETNTNYWIEKCIVKGRIDRESGDNSLGKALWSPQTGSAGSNIYSEMLDTQPGDIVFHLVDNNHISGISIVADKVDENFICLENTDWAGRKGYRIPLRDYIKLDPPLDRNFIFKDRDLMINIVQNNKKLFCTSNLDLRQGGYFTKLPTNMVSYWNNSYKKITNKNLPHVIGDKTLSFQNYSVDNIISDGCFMSKERIEKIIDKLKVKKNLILQGPPGTGKTWLAKRLGYALIGEKDISRLRSFQFHPSLSYEDFIRGYRPSENEKLALKDGPFMEAINEAKKTSGPYVIVIEEINRGNPAQIFGEMLTLLEADKRNSDEAIELTYKNDIKEKVFIPDNLYVIGTMNLADRSLALVDLALRRRFAFADLEPSLNNTWENWLQSKGISRQFINEIRARMERLNNQIADDNSLGNQYKIGHSYVTPMLEISDQKEWFLQIIESEIGPLLDEYWFDNVSRAEEEKNKLREGL